MRWLSLVSREHDLDAALAEIGEAMGELTPDLLLVFASSHHARDAARLAGAVQARWPAVVAGCSGGGVIGGGREWEEGAALVIMAAELPNVEVRAAHVTTAVGLSKAVGLGPDMQPVFLVLAEPSSIDAQALATAMDQRWAGCAKFGGLASGDERVLLCGGAAHRGGAVVVSLAGDVEGDTVVAQGCRPLGPVLTVTRARRNVLVELDGRSALLALEEALTAMAAEERALFRRSPLVGLAADPEFARPGDFLVRNLVGLDRAMGVIAVGWPVEEGATIQFHARDAAFAAQELGELLARRRGPTPDVALLFSCLGRGRGLFGRPDHDSRMLTRHLGPIPIGGFFCAGEIGPVRSRSFVHGYTSSVGLLRARGWD
jgi:small ligand-binding sensory domain FIST